VMGTGYSGQPAASRIVQPRGIEWILTHLRVPDHVARLLAATPSLRWSWLVAGAVTVSFSAWAAHAGEQGMLLFLVVAPLLPVGGVAAAYGPWMDPMHELAQAAPTSSLHLVLIRSTAVLGTVLALVGIAAASLPGTDWTAVAWILPALALTLSSIALATFVPVQRAAAAVALLWFATLTVAELGFATPFALFHGVGQLAFFVVVVVSAIVFALRRGRLEMQGRMRRQGFLAAAEQERRRIERNIHDGAQQQLVAISVKVGLAKTMVASAPSKAAALMEEIQAEAQEALDSLREMTRGTYPPALADGGLAEALAAKVRSFTPPVEIKADALGRFPPEVETAVYFCCLEALQNVAKYAHARRATVSLRCVGGEIAFSVTDDGEGFDTATVRRGIGLRSMAERVSVLGGVLDVRSHEGGGTTVQGRIPLGVGIPTHV
jgi:signal transduction histidine kinase